MLISLIASSSGVASPAVLVSTIRSTSPSAPRTIRPYWPGSSSSRVVTVAAAPDDGVALGEAL